RFAIPGQWLPLERPHHALPLLLRAHCEYYVRPTKTSAPHIIFDRDDITQTQNHLDATRVLASLPRNPSARYATSNPAPLPLKKLRHCVDKSLYQCLALIVINTGTVFEWQPNQEKYRHDQIQYY